MTDPLLDVRSVTKAFRMHLRGGLELPVVRDVSFAVAPGECVVLGGPSGVGKSSILRMVYGNYGVDAGAILVRERETGALRDLGAGDPRAVLGLRRGSIAYVSQFLRAVPRVPALDVVAEPLLGRGMARPEAQGRAAAMLHQAEPARRAARAAARHLLGRREAARQHRPRLPHRPSGPAARRAHRLARRREPRRRGGDDPREARRRHRHPRHLPRRGRARPGGDPHRRRVVLLGQQSRRTVADTRQFSGREPVNRLEEAA